MFEKHTSDFHCHLNGSLSLEYLKGVATINDELEAYDKLVEIQKDYLAKTDTPPQEGYSKEVIKLIWDQFGLIHQIIKTTHDITLGVIDVISQSEASYLEIRTTPKALGEKSKDDYIDAFELGLKLMQKKESPVREAYGLLSLDRTIEDLDSARHILRRVIHCESGLLKGIDISGNPLKPRTLRGDSLKMIILEALENNIGLGIHMGEADTVEEKEDIDTILGTLLEWSQQQAFNEKLFFGRVRLGHCIYLTPDQKDLIRQLNIPVEICPTCHSKLNWHLKDTPHPTQEIYQDIENPVVFGTDDPFIFGKGAKEEFSSGLTFFENKKQLSRKEIKEYQSQFRFQ